MQLLHDKLRTFKSTINACLAITIEPALRLLKLQQDALAKQKLVNETCVQATTIKTFIVERNFKQSLTRRLNQIKTRDKLNDEQPSKLSTIKMFCNNGSDLTWDIALNRLPFLIQPNHVSVSIDRMLHLTNLLESSSIVSMADIIEVCPDIISGTEPKFVNVLLKFLPLYSITYDGGYFLVNIHQTTNGCDIIDHILQVNKPLKVNIQDHETTKETVKKDSAIATVHKKRGQPSIVSVFPTIPDVVTEFVKVNGFKAQEKRRDDDFTACGVSVEDIRRHLLKSIPGLAQHGISGSTIRYLFAPVNKGRLSAARYKSLVSCRVPKKDNSLRK